MKRLMALVTVATLTLGSATMVLASQATTTPAETETVEAKQTESALVTEAPAAVVEAAAEVVATPVEVANVELSVEEKSHQSPSGQIIGVRPEFKDNEDLTKKVSNLLGDAYAKGVNNSTYSADEHYSYAIFGYDVEETAALAKVEITQFIPKGVASLEEKTIVIATYYIDKATNAEVTAEAYEATVLPAEEAPAEEAPAEEAPVEEVPAVEVPVPATLPLRAHAEALGYVVDWNEGVVTLTKGEVTATLTQGVNEYVNLTGEKVTLTAAPVNVEGTLVVPTEFFTQILGATVTANVDGSVVVAVVETEVPVEEAAAPETAQPTEDPAETEAPVETPADEKAPADDKPAA